MSILARTHITSVHMFDHTYEFVDPIVISGNIFPRQAVLDLLHTRFPDFVGSDSELINQYGYIVNTEYGTPCVLQDYEIKDLISIYDSYVRSPDRQRWIKIQTENNKHIYYGADHIACEIFIANPLISVYDFIREVNLKVNDKTDDLILQRRDGSYYVWDSWKNISDDAIKDIFMIDQDLDYLLTYVNDGQRAWRPWDRRPPTP